MRGSLADTLLAYDSTLDECLPALAGSFMFQSDARSDGAMPLRRIGTGFSSFAGVEDCRTAIGNLTGADQLVLGLITWLREPPL